ncbi:MAG TPA: helix-turn-helix domain-containing protein [Dehalococcoidia bacterium]|nr:helix-turn-helix domain-containing protein [Dehalococcoidia bacterium]
MSGRRYAGQGCGQGNEAPFEPLASVFEAPPRAPRRDGLPEHTHYADTGCDLHPSCLSCPLARCRYDEPGGARAIAGRDRDEAILRARRQEGVTVEVLARRFGVSRRTVFRVLARAREEVR